jgi:serine/threonine protein phosphatase PrpC
LTQKNHCVAELLSQSFDGGCFVMMDQWFCCSLLCLQRFELQVQPGDIIVTGSDGLWDNIFAEEAATIASKCRDKGETATTAAQVLCR